MVPLCFPDRLSIISVFDSTYVILQMTVDALILERHVDRCVCALWGFFLFFFPCESFPLIKLMESHWSMLFTCICIVICIRTCL